MRRNLYTRHDLNILGSLETFCFNHIEGLLYSQSLKFQVPTSAEKLKFFGLCFTRSITYWPHSVHQYVHSQKEFFFNFPHKKRIKWHQKHELLKHHLVNSGVRMMILKFICQHSFWLLYLIIHSVSCLGNKGLCLMCDINIQMLWLPLTKILLLKNFPQQHLVMLIFMSS